MGDLDLTEVCDTLKKQLLEEAKPNGTTTGRLTRRHGKYAVQIGGETRRHDKGWLQLAEYEDMIEQGLLLELPCRVGEPMYFITAEPGRGRFVDSMPFHYEWLDYRTPAELFTTREEAEAKLAELKGGTNG